jgi:peptide/nickel transport system substrate-binding protein
MLAAVAGALLLLAAASAEPARSGRYGGVLVVGLTRGAPGSLDPTFLSNVSTVEVLRTICQRLYDFDARSHVVPELAASLPTISPDKLTYTIPLRQGIEFNDGTPFNAQAVVTTIERDINLPGSSRAIDLSSVDTVTTSGPYTVVVHLKTPYTPLLKTLASNDGDVMSPTALASEGANFGQDPICVGPFMFDHQVPGASITVIKSPYYYDRLAVHLDKIVFQVESDAPTAAAALQSGDLQMLDSVDPVELPAFTNNPGFHLFKQASLGFEALRFNIGNSNNGSLPYSNVGTPWAKSASLREAFEEAIDRNTLVKVVYEGAALPGCTPISPASPDYDPTIQCTPYDPARARKLVAESGYPNPTLHLIVPDTTALVRLAQFVQAEEAAAGINVIVDLDDSAAVQSAEVKGSFPASVVTWSGSQDTDRNVYQWLATTGTLNHGGYSNPRLDQILANTRKAQSQTALKTLYRAAFEIILADRPLIYLDHPIVTAAVSTSVRGVQFLSDAQARVSLAQYR